MITSSVGVGTNGAGPSGAWFGAAAEAFAGRDLPPVDLAVELRDPGGWTSHRAYAGGRLRSIGAGPLPAPDLVVVVPRALHTRVGLVPLPPRAVDAVRVLHGTELVRPYPLRVTDLVGLERLPRLPGLDLTIRYEVFGSAFGDLAWTERWSDGRRTDAQIEPSAIELEADVRLSSVVDVYRTLQQGGCCARRFLELGGGVAGDWPLLMAFAGLVEEDAHRATMVVPGPTEEELAWARIVTHAEHVAAAARLAPAPVPAGRPGGER